jgi:hypothetical protein
MVITSSKIPVQTAICDLFKSWITTGFLDFVHRPEFCKQENTTFRKLDLFPSSGKGGGHLLPFPQWSSSVLTTTWINPFSPHLSGPREFASSLWGNIKKAEDAFNCFKPLWTGKASDKLKLIYSDSTRYFKPPFFFTRYVSYPGISALKYDMPAFIQILLISSFIIIHSVIPCYII